MSDFLLEIGVEEIPDWMIEPALADLERQFGQFVSANALGSSPRVTTAATPRRLVLKAAGLIARQADETKTISGPPVSAGEGAAKGFAKKNNVSFEALSKSTTAKGEYYTLEQKVVGRAAKDLLGEALPGIITGIQWPKTMYWTGKNGPRFIRPIRWILALLDDEIVPFEIAGVQSGNSTSGHRRLGGASIPVTIGTYDDVLAKNFVILDAAERRRRIESNLGHGVKKDDQLLHTLVYLTEYPTPIRGGFDPSYLELPEEILSTVMRHHQRYFTVEENGKMAPSFVAVMNTNADPEGLVRHGNERVLRARFNDARFFFTKDQERKLADRVQDLRAVTFQARLGNYYEKTERNVALAERAARTLGANEEYCTRAAYLAKADLTTEMVKEFTELQGIVGGLYARKQGEPDEVAQAIYEHYKPTSMEDSIPSTLTGQIVALADKLDTLRGCFAIDLIPSGSKDPFALRRAAQGVVKIVVEGKLRLPLQAQTASDQRLSEFVLDRARYYFRDIRGFAYDEVNAVMNAGFEDLVDVEERLIAIKAVRPTENFEPLAASFKRIKNILRQAEFTGAGEIDEAKLEPGPEADLYAAYRQMKAAIANQPYGTALANIAALRPTVDKFFDKVLVNAPDEAVRRNRLTLLSHLLTESSAIADFSEIVTQ